MSETIEVLLVTDTDFDHATWDKGAATSRLLADGLEATAKRRGLMLNDSTRRLETFVYNEVGIEGAAKYGVDLLPDQRMWRASAEGTSGHIQ